MANQFGIDLGAVQNQRYSNALNKQALQLNNAKLQSYRAQQEAAPKINALNAKFYQTQDPKERQQIAGQMGAIDPKAAADMEDRISKMNDAQKEEMDKFTQTAGKLAASILAVPDSQFDAAYAIGRERAHQMHPGIVDDAPPDDAPIPVKRQYLQMQLDQASGIKEILDRNKPAASTFGQPQKVIGPDGKPTLVQVDKDGNVRALDGYAPIPTGMKLTTSPDGSVTLTTGDQTAGTQTQELTNPTKNTIQKELAALDETFARVSSIKEKYNPSFLTYQGKIGTTISKLKDKANIGLSDEEKKYLKDYTKFTTLVNRDFNGYRREITGAAASVQELESLKKATIADDQSPAQFEANIEVYQEELARSMRIKRRLLREGLSVGDKGFGGRFDDLYLSGADDDKNARFAELTASGMDDKAALDKMIVEGY